jgi:hypothetical protein
MMALATPPRDLWEELEQAELRAELSFATGARRDSFLYPCGGGL